MSAVVAAEGVGVSFAFDRQRRLVTPTLARLRRRGPEVAGLQTVTFSIRPGEGVALLGPSGAGKTTLLRVIAGVLRPDSGRMDVRGRVAALLSVEAGLMPSLTGRENALLLAVLAGMSRERARRSLDDIERRSGLGTAFDLPVSSYSHGMKARLAYSVWAESVPDVIVLDEVHEALDHEYRSFIAQDMAARRAAGAAVVAAGHDHAMLELLCDRALLLEHGRVSSDGRFADVVRHYLAGDVQRRASAVAS
jgi:ABC-type polysaccharide/polyol phosphate transport system ATPase subunit